MSYVIKKNRGTSAKFKSLSVDSEKRFIDLETGSVIDLADILAKSFGENEPMDLSATIKSDEDITDEI